VDYRYSFSNLGCVFDFYNGSPALLLGSFFIGGKINIRRNLENWKKVLYIYFMKTVKISPSVHKELKTYVAQKEENISDVAGFAIMEYLKASGHKFTSPKSKTSKK
jgi:hypothetical protein